MNKENASESLITKLDSYVKQNDEEVLVSNAKEIYAQITKVSEPLEFKQIEFPMNVDTHIYMRKDKTDIEISLSELMILVDKFIEVKDSKKLQYKS
jgi:hypothetical protein